MSTMSQSESLDRAVKLVQIHALLHRYAFVARNGLKWEEFAKTFHDDTQFKLANNKVVSALQWKEIVEGEQAEYIRHHVTTIDVQFETPTKAVATTQFFALTHASMCDHWGEWKFVVSRDEEYAWLIDEVTIVLDGADPNGWAAANYKHG